MEQKIIILSAKAWEMTDEKSGITRKGTTVWYIPESEQAVNADGSCGVAPVKEIMDYDFVEQVKAVGGAPVHCNATMRFGSSGNQQVIKVVSVKFTK